MYRIRLNTAKGPSEYGLYLPVRILEGLGITPGSHCQIQVGQKVVRTRVGAAPQSRVAGDLKQKLRLPPGVLRLHVDFKDNRIVLGPFLGILARPQISSPYGEQTAFFRRLIARAKAMHIYAFVLGPDDINLEQASVTGHRPYKTTTTWVTRRCPLPDCIFDRGFFKGAEKIRMQKLMKRLMHDHGVRIFNEQVGNKWDIHQVLLQDPQLVAHLPETAQAMDEKVVDDFIKRYRFVYVKPAGGNQGRHVFRVRYRQNRVAYDAHMRQGRIVRTSLPSLSAFMKELEATRERSPYIVQQGLNLAKVQGRAADVRALVQRDRGGEWRLTGAGVRIGGSSVVSNLHAGGNAAKLDVLVPRSGRKARVAELQAQIERITLRVAQTLSQYKLLGELGIDLGLDLDGHLWIIEVNLKPGRATFRRAGLDEAWRRSGIAPLEFSLYLWANPQAPVKETAAPEDEVVADNPITLGGYVPVLTRKVLI